MDHRDFIGIGENIHCTRIITSSSKRVVSLRDGREGISFSYKGKQSVLPVPENWVETSPIYSEKKILHVALAIHQTLNGNSEDQENGKNYLRYTAERQIENGANFLTVNIDDYGSDLQERIEIMKWLGQWLSKHYEIPLSIDSSNIATIAAGLSVCKKSVTPLVNSVNLGQDELVDIVVEYGAEAVVSAAGRKTLPSSVDDRLENLHEIVEIFASKGVVLSRMYLDPLVFSISVDPQNGVKLFSTVSRAKEAFPEANITGGLSNVSYGMPNRKLLNQVFMKMFIQAGGNSGIIDPVQLSPSIVETLDLEEPSSVFARNVLEGKDPFGLEYIAAYRKGKL